MSYVKAVASITPMQAASKGQIYEAFKAFTTIRLLEWGDRIVATDNDTTAKFRCIFHLSSRRELLTAQIATLKQELVPVAPSEQLPPPPAVTPMEVVIPDDN